MNLGFHLKNCRIRSEYFAVHFAPFRNIPMLFYLSSCDSLMDRRKSILDPLSYKRPMVNLLFLGKILITRLRQGGSPFFCHGMIVPVVCRNIGSLPQFLLPLALTNAYLLFSVHIQFRNTESFRRPMPVFVFSFLRIIRGTIRIIDCPPLFISCISIYRSGLLFPFSRFCKASDCK